MPSIRNHSVACLRLPAHCCAFFALTIFFVTPAVQADTPDITQVIGSAQEGKTLSITGRGFTEKAHDRPLLVWRADDGENPNPDLGRLGEWRGDASIQGEMTKAVTAPGSSASLRFDHSLSTGRALGRVDFEGGRAYVFRKIKEGFDIQENYAISSEITDLDGELKEGQRITGESSGATGYVGTFSPYSDGKGGRIQYAKDMGSIYEDEPVDFEYQEMMRTETARMRNVQGNEQYPTGTWRQFNLGSFRFMNRSDWNAVSFGAEGLNSSSMRLGIARTGNTVWSGSWDNPKRLRPHIWQSEEMSVDSGSIDQEDAILRVRSDGLLNLDLSFTARNQEYPEAYNQIHQSIIPRGGAQPETYMYYDILYVDDSWHRVILCSSETYKSCKDPEVQLVQKWQGGRNQEDHIEFILRKGAIQEADTGYLYVVNGQEAVNPRGYPIALGGAAAPKPPSVALVCEPDCD